MVDIDVQYVFQKKVLLICPFDLEIFSSTWLTFRSNFFPMSILAVLVYTKERWVFI